MGLFSTRKSEDNLEHNATSSGGNENAVVRVIRSRLYGKNKGKGRESPSVSYIPTDVSASQTLSPGPNAHPYLPSLSSPLARSKNSKQTMGAAPDSPRIPGDIEPATPPPRNAKRPHPGSPDMLSPPPPKSPATANRQREREKEKEKEGETSGFPTTPASSPRKTADSVTVTLAQKLNELALANSEGLLSDDEYRLLRQNLFERFATTTTVPTESPIVPVAKPRPRNNDSPSSSSRPAVSRPLSTNFQLEIKRSPSRTSLSTGVASLFRRATGRRTTSTSKDLSDGSSFVSEKSASSSMPHTLARRSSVSSVNTSASHAPTDSISITSRKMHIGSDRAHWESVTSFSPTGTRSTAGSVRRFHTPPSSFRAAGLDSKQLGSYSGLYDDDRLQTSQDFKEEILSVEAEAKNMMDAFNGLELTTLTKLQKATGRNSVIGPDGPQSTWTLVPDGQSNRMNVDNDGSSIMSGTSGRTSASIARSAYSARKVRPKKSLGSPIVMHRQNSMSSVNLAGHGTTSINAMANSSNISLTKSINHSPMRVVPGRGEDRGMVMVGDGDEMEEIRRRREEVMMRYEARLEYLRARLKGAQLHEKLLRK